MLAASMTKQNRAKASSCWIRYHICEAAGNTHNISIMPWPVSV